MKKTVKHGIVLFLCCILTACRHDYIKPKSFDVNTPVSFSQDIVPIFTDNCAKSGCHITGGQVPNLTLSKAYDQLLGLGYVDTANAEASIIYVRMNSNDKPMPSSGKLSNEKINKVLAWIKQGAKND